ncbi:MAG: PAS domain-containing protein [Nocardioidaceae bacterium]
MAFRASSAGYLVVDCDLNIRAANPSYEQATLHRGADMIGEFVFDVFPDNPDAPEAQSVRNLESSLVSVLRNAGPHRMRLQRYDVLGPYTGMFVKKTWLPVNSPIFDSDGHTIGILHHVEDVSHLVVATSLERLLSIPAGTATTEADHIADARRFAERARRDAVLRRQGADALFARSVRAVDRSARSMSAMGSRSLGPARQQINGFRRLGR